jgi:hypothetical protein
VDSISPHLKKVKRVQKTIMWAERTHVIMDWERSSVDLLPGNIFAIKRRSSLRGLGDPFQT